MALEVAIDESRLVYRLYSEYLIAIAFAESNSWSVGKICLLVVEDEAVEIFRADQPR